MASVRRTDTSDGQSTRRAVNCNSHPQRNMSMNCMEQSTESDLTEQQSNLFGRNNMDDAMNQGNEDPMMKAEKALYGGFDDDNRVCIPRTLSHVSPLHGLSGSPVGATLRVARHLTRRPVAVTISRDNAMRISACIPASTLLISACHWPHE